ncbi:MAG: 1-deoxy-D-xylulose-5-phosphate synthase [Lachnospiraceae bacterium]|nr:1-deoxy-D-xylulose-5-phosphate synthase [Lachnospiraceae bacterium]
MCKVLDKINTPKDLKALSRKELVQLCGEIRQQMILRLSVTGGHVGSNLSVIEATVALHYVFDSPVDKIIFDVSHQCYTHKLLTGRKAAYTDPARFSTVSGFTNPAESGHDIFSIGHTSTAVSLACGMAKGRDVKEESHNVIALVGDGALSGGEAFEGLNNASVLGSNIILIINDNDMSIAENHGGFYQNLRLLRETDGKADCNLFRALGFDYFFVRDGNDFNEIADMLELVKDTNHPVVVHMCTVKGKGYRFAEADRENWHYMGPFDIDTGKRRQEAVPAETYEALTAAYLADKMRMDSAVTAITAGTPKVLGFEEELRNQFPKQFVDVGIAEGHAVAMISGIAKAGGKPVFGVSSSFLQRAYDQLSSDLALNQSPAVILVFFAGISGGSQTHMGIFDMALAANIPGIIYLAPTCKEEYFSMLEWGLNQTEYPVIIRVPGIETVSRDAALLSEYSYPAKYEIAEHGTMVAILALGKFFELGKSVREKLDAEYGIRATLINPRYASAVDEVMLNALPEYGHRLVVTLEDGVIDGGFGEKISRFYGTSPMKVLSFGAGKEFVNHVAADEQYFRYRLTPEQIVSDILKEISEHFRNNF